MNTKTFYIDIDRSRFLSEQGGILTEWPTIAYGACPTWTLRFVRPDTLGNLQPIDVSEAVSWHAAIDTDFNRTTLPMVRTLDEDIDKSAVTSGILQVPLNANNTSFQEKIGTRNSIQAFFEVRGYDPSGYVIYDYRMNMYALGAVDPEGSEPIELPSGYATQDWTRALLRAAPEFQFSEDGISDWHETRDIEDDYFRVRNPEGQWSEAILIVNGIPPSLSSYATIEYVDNVSGWLYSNLSGETADPNALTGVSLNGTLGTVSNKVASLTLDTSSFVTASSLETVSGNLHNEIAAIPSANNGVLTITQGGTTKGTFSANASENVTIELDAGGGGGGGSDPNALTGVTLNGVAGTITDKVAALNVNIPTVGNGTLTITQDGTTKGTFSANASGDVTIALDAGGGGGGEGLNAWVKGHLAYQDKNHNFGSSMIPEASELSLVSSQYNDGQPIYILDPTYKVSGIPRYYPSAEYMASHNVGHMFRPGYHEIRVLTNSGIPSGVVIGGGGVSNNVTVYNEADSYDLHSYLTKHNGTYYDSSSFYLCYIETSNYSGTNNYIIQFKGNGGDSFENPFSDTSRVVDGIVISATINWHVDPDSWAARDNIGDYWYNGLGQIAFQAVYIEEDSIWILVPYGKLQKRYVDEQMAVWDDTQYKDTGIPYAAKLSGVSITSTWFEQNNIGWPTVDMAYRFSDHSPLTLSGALYYYTSETVWGSQDISPWRNINEIVPTISGWMKYMIASLQTSVISSCCMWVKDISLNPAHALSASLSSITAQEGDMIHYPNVPVIGAWIDNSTMGIVPEIEISGLPSGVNVKTLTSFMWDERDYPYPEATDESKRVTLMYLDGKYLTTGQGTINIKAKSALCPVNEYNVSYIISGAPVGGATFAGDYSEFSSLHYEGSFVPTQSTVTFKEWVNSATYMRTVPILSGSIHVTGEGEDWEGQPITVDEYRTIWLCPVGGMENYYFWNETADDAARQALIENEDIHPAYSWGLYENNTAPSDILESSSAIGYFPPQTNDTLPALQSANSAWTESAGSWENITLTVS